jgi:hypothetical protein
VAACGREVEKEEEGEVREESVICSSEKAKERRL